MGEEEEYQGTGGFRRWKRERRRKGRRKSEGVEDIEKRSGEEELEFGRGGRH